MELFLFIAHKQGVNDIQQWRNNQNINIDQRYGIIYKKVTYQVKQNYCYDYQTYRYYFWWKYSYNYRNSISSISYIAFKVFDILDYLAYKISQKGKKGQILQPSK